MLRTSDAKFVSRFDGVEAALVGEIISDALHHRVYAYGENKVLKVPKKPFKFLFSEKLHLEEDLARLHEFFPGLAVETDVLTSRDHKYHCIIQRRLFSRQITPHTIDEVRPAFEKLLARNREMIQKYGDSLDFFGQAGVKSCVRALRSRAEIPYLSNLVIVEEGGRPIPKLLDTELLRMRIRDVDNRAEFAALVLSVGSFFVNRLFLRWFFKVRL
jgi:hypothetical protein